MAEHIICWTVLLLCVFVLKQLFPSFSVPCLSTDCPPDHETIKKRSINPEDVRKSPDDFNRDIEVNKANRYPDGSDVIGQHKTQFDLSREETIISTDGDKESVEMPVEEPDLEVAVHGTAHVHDLGVPETTSSPQSGSVLPDQEEALHDAKNVHNTADRAEHADARLSAMSQRRIDVDPDEMLHGSGSDHFHSDDDAGLSGGLLPPPDAPNPEWMIMGLGVARDDEKDDFLAWKSSAESKGADTVMKGASWLWRGFSFPFVSDTIDDDETLMKKRYLTRIEEAINAAEVDKLDTE